MNERLNRAITQLRDEGVTVTTRDVLTVLVGSGEGEEVILTHAQLLELMDNDQLTWQGIKDLHRASKKHFTLHQPLLRNLPKAPRTPRSL